MKICGLNKLTLLDYPGNVAATIFLGGCNLRCPFCQNGGLVLSPDREPEITTEEVLRFLKIRQGILDGVCISGGEPTLSEGLLELARQIKKLGYKVKLDTNGSKPEVIETMLEEELVDFVAMDIKSSLENYGKVAGIAEMNTEQIEVSVCLIMDKAPDYEFRTTVVRQLHNEEDFVSIGKWLAGAKAYYLQAYVDSETVISPGFTAYDKIEMEKFCQVLRTSISQVSIRGLD